MPFEYVKMKKHLVFTFDYELFLGKKSGRPEDCILLPTERIRYLMKRYSAKAIFFVDTTYLSALKKYSKFHPACDHDFNRIALQIHQLIDDGHYVYPHIHPHWEDATYDPISKEFDLSNVGKYRFNMLNKHQQEDVFGASMRILTDIIKPTKPDYKIQAFRAGGWSVQPFSDFKPYFLKYGIRFDMSVVPRLYQFSNAQYFDYSNAPERPVYSFEDDVCQTAENGPFIEVRGSIIFLPKLVRWLNRGHRKLLYKLGYDRDYGKGIGQQSKEQRGFNPVSDNGINLFDRTHEVASIENLSSVKMRIYQEKLAQEGYLHLVSHPKMLSKHNFFILDRFLHNVFNNDTPETDYLKTADWFLAMNTHP
jgi:hypothetical protein